MATVRELQAEFTARAAGWKSTIQSVKKELTSIGTTTEKSVDKANRSYRDLVSETDKLKQAIADSADPKAFDRLNKAIDQTEKEFKETGQIGEKTMAELKSAINESSGSFGDLSQEGRQAINQISKNIDGLEVDLKQLGTDTGLTEMEVDGKQAVQGINQSVNTLNNELKALGSESDLKQLGADGRTALTEINKRTNILNTEIKQLGADSSMDELSAEGRKAINRINASTSMLSNEFKRLGSDVNFDNISAEGRQAIERIDQSVSDLDSNIRVLGTQSGMSGFASEGRQAVNRVEQSVNSLDNELRDLGKETGLNEVNEQVQELGENAQETASPATTGLFAALGGAIGGMRGKALAASAGIAALGGSILSSISVGSEFTGAMNNLAIQTGATEDEIEQLEQSLKNIYQTGAGESFDDIANAMATVRSATKLTGDELEEATQIALDLRDVFDWDVDELMRSVRGMMTNFNLSAEESFTLLAQGRQEMGSSADDLLDTFNEYGHAFADLGFNGEEAMNMIMNSMDAGVRNTDIAA